MKRWARALRFSHRVLVSTTIYRSARARGTYRSEIGVRSATLNFALHSYAPTTFPKKMLIWTCVATMC